MFLWLLWAARHDLILGGRREVAADKSSTYRESLMLDAELFDMLDRGASFEQIEEWIDGLACKPTQKNVLWLLAWSEAPRWYRRSARQDLLAGVENGG